MKNVAKQGLTICHVNRYSCTAEQIVKTEKQTNEQSREMQL